MYDAAYSSCQACQLCRSGPACSANVEFKLDVTDRPRSDGGGTYVKATPVSFTFYSCNSLVSAPISHRQKHQPYTLLQRLPKASLLQTRQHVQVYGRQGKGEGSRQWDVSNPLSPPLTAFPTEKALIFEQRQPKWRLHSRLRTNVPCRSSLDKLPLSSQWHRREDRERRPQPSLIHDWQHDSFWSRHPSDLSHGRTSDSLLDLLSKALTNLPCSTSSGHSVPPVPSLRPAKPWPATKASITTPHAPTYTSCLASHCACDQPITVWRRTSRLLRWRRRWHRA